MPVLAGEVVTRVGGAKARGFRDGDFEALLDSPTAVAVAGTSTFVCVDAHSVRLAEFPGHGDIGSHFTVRTLAGSSVPGQQADGALSSARFLYPQGVAVRRKPQPQRSRKAGLGSSRQAGSGEAEIADGREQLQVVVCDGSNAVKLVDLDSQRVSVILGANDFGRGGEAPGKAFDSPSNEGRSIRREHEEMGVTARQIRGHGEHTGITALAIDDPHDVCFADTTEEGLGSSGRFFISDNSRIYEMNLDKIRSGASVLCGGLVGFGEGHRREQQKEHLAEDRQQKQQKQQGDLGKPVRGYRDGSLAESLFDRPDGLAFDAQSSILYVADTGNHCIRSVNLKTGQVRTVAGGSEAGYRDGEASKALFRFPQKIAFHVTSSLLSPSPPSSAEAESASTTPALARTTKRLFVTELNDCVRTVLLPRPGQGRCVVSTLAGVASQRGLEDGEARTARFSFPAGICVCRRGLLGVANRAEAMGEHDDDNWNAAPVGSLVVADSDNHALREIELLDRDQHKVLEGDVERTGSPWLTGRSRASVVGAALSRVLLELSTTNEQEEQEEADELLSQLDKHNTVAVRALWRQRQEEQGERKDKVLSHGQAQRRYPRHNQHQQQQIKVSAKERGEQPLARKYRVPSLMGRPRARSQIGSSYHRQFLALLHEMCSDCARAFRHCPLSLLHSGLFRKHPPNSVLYIVKALCTLICARGLGTGGDLDLPEGVQTTGDATAFLERHRGKLQTLLSRCLPRVGSGHGTSDGLSEHSLSQLEHFVARLGREDMETQETQVHRIVKWLQSLVGVERYRWHHRQVFFEPGAGAGVEVVSGAGSRARTGPSAAATSTPTSSVDDDGSRSQLVRASAPAPDPLLAIVRRPEAKSPTVAAVSTATTVTAGGGASSPGSQRVDELLNTIQFLEQELSAAQSQLQAQRGRKKKAKQETFLKLALELSTPHSK